MIQRVVNFVGLLFGLQSHLLCLCLAFLFCECSQRHREATRNELLGTDLLTLNIASGKDLPGISNQILEGAEDALKTYIDRVRAETDRHHYRFRQRPAEFENSEGFFRMVMMSVVLTEDFGIRYDPRRQVAPEATDSNDSFFADARYVFIHGLLGPERLGTCSSLPVLYAAIGRKLGYPLKLVTTKGHLFLRWEGNGEGFNIEATGHGVNKFDDDYYRRWPFPITPEEEQAEGYLKSLTPEGEMAVFLSIRGMCLRDNQRYAEAAVAFSQAAMLAPGVRSYRLMTENMSRMAGRSLAQAHEQSSNSKTR